MSSTSDTGPISQAVEVADEVEHRTLVEKIEKATEGAEEAVSHLVLGTDKEESKTENVSGTIENQTNGKSKDELRDGAIGVPIEKADSEIPVTSTPTIDPKDDVLSDVITSDEHTSTFIPTIKSSKPEDANIIHHNDESGDRPGEKILIPSSDETQTEEHLDTDDTKMSQTAEVESVQEPSKEELALPTYNDTKAPTSEEIIPAPKHEAESDAASTEAPIEVPPEHLGHSPPATDSEDTQPDANCSPDKPTHTEAEARRTIEEPGSDMDHTPSSDPAPVVASEAEPETHVEVKGESDVPCVEEGNIEPPMREEEKPTEVALETPLETKNTEESESPQGKEVSVVEGIPADLEKSEAVEASSVQEKALEAEDKAEEPTESAPNVDEAEESTSVDPTGVISTEPSHDHIDTPVVNDHVLAPDAANEQSHTTNEEASAEESKLETGSSLVEESKPEAPKTEEASYEPATKITTEATPASEGLQEPVATEPKTEDHTLEPPLTEEAAPQVTDSTPKVEASAEGNSSEKAVIETPISAEVKEDEAPVGSELATDVAPEEKETWVVYEEGVEITTLPETAQADEKETPVSSEPSLVEAQIPEEQVVSVVESSEHVEESAVSATAEEAKHETEVNGKEGVHSDEVKEEPKSYTEVVQESAPEASAEEIKPEPEASVQETLALVAMETKPEPQLITDETAHIEEALVISELVNETPAPAVTKEHELAPETEAATEQTTPVEESVPVSAPADEHSESAPVEKSEVWVEMNGESSTILESEEVKEEVSAVMEEPKAEDKASLSDAEGEKPEAGQTKVEGDAETEPGHTSESTIEQAPLEKSDTEVASKEPHVEATEIEGVSAIEQPLEDLTPVTEEPVLELAQTPGPVSEEVLDEEAPAVVGQAAEVVLEETPHAQEALVPTEDSVMEEESIVEEKASEETPVMFTREPKNEEAEAAPEAPIFNETAKETPGAENQQTEATSVAPEGISTTEETPTTETTAREVSTLVDSESAEQTKAAEELVEVPAKVEEPLVVENPETEVVTPAAEQGPVASEEESALEHAAAVDELVTELEAPTAEEPLPQATEEVPVEQPSVEHSAAVEEPFTEAPAPVIEEEQVITPAVEEVLVEHSAVVEEPVTETPAPVIEEEQVIMPAVEEVSAEELSVEHLAVVELVTVIEEEHIITPATEEVLVEVEKPLVEHSAVVEEPVTVIEEEHIITPAIEEVLVKVEEPSVEHSAVAEEPVTETPAPVIEEEHIIAPTIEVPVKEPSAEHSAVVEELFIEASSPAIEEELIVASAIETPAPAIKEEQVITSAAEEGLVEELLVKHSAVVEEPVPVIQEEHIIAPEIEESVEHSAVEKSVIEASAPGIEGEQVIAPEVGEARVEEPLVEHSTIVEGPVTEAPVPVIEEEQVRTPAIEEALVDQPHVEHETLEEQVVEATMPVVQTEEVPAPQVEVPTVEEFSVTTTEEPAAVEDLATEAETPAMDEQTVSTPAVEEVPTEEPPVKHYTVVESATGIETHAVEEVDALTSPVELVTAADDPPVEESINVEEPAIEAVTPVAQEEEARAPVIEETLAEQPPVGYATVEEPVTETLITPTPIQEEVPMPAVEVVSEKPPVEHAPVQETVTEAPTAPAPEQEISTPAIEEVPKEHAFVEEPVSDAPLIPAPAQEEISAPAIEVVSVEKLIEHTPVEEPVAEAPPTPASKLEEAPPPATPVEHVFVEELVTKTPTPAPEQEEVSIPVVEEALAENPSVEHALAEEPVTEVQTPACGQELSIPAIDEVSVENTPVEHAPVVEPVTEAQAPVAEQEQVSIPAIEISAENPPVEQTLVEEPAAEAVAPAVQGEEAITPLVEEVAEQPTVQQALVEQSRTEAPAPATEQEPTPTIEEVLAEDPLLALPAVEELVIEALTTISEQEQVSTPAIEEVPLVEESVTAPVTHVKEEQVSALISESLVQEPTVERAIPGGEPEAEPDSHMEGATVAESTPEASEPTLATEVQSVEGDVVLITGGKESPAPSEDIANIEGVPETVPEAQVPPEEPVEDVEPIPTEEEDLKTEAIGVSQEHASSEDAKEGLISITMEVPQEQKEAEPAESHEETAAAPEDKTEVTLTDTEKQASIGVVEPEVVTTGQLVLVYEPKPEEGVPGSANVEDEFALEAATENAVVEHIYESSVDVSAPVEVLPISGGDVPSTKEEEIAVPIDLPLAPEMDKLGIPEETVAAKVPVEETTQEQRDFDAELAVAQALLSQSASVSPAEVIPQNPSEEQQPIEVLNDTSTEIPSIPTLVVTKTEENQPSHGGYFGVDATASQKDVHELSKVDSEPDEVVTAPEPETPSISTEGIVVGVDDDIGKDAIDDEFEHISHADAVPDEQELRHEECVISQEPQVGLPESTTPILVACETAAAVADSAVTIDPINRSTAPTPIPVAAEIAAAVEDTAVGLDPTDRSVAPTPIPVAVVEDTAATLDVGEARSRAPTPILEATETAAAVQDTSAILDPTDLSVVPTPILVIAETTDAVGDTAATLDVDENGLEVLSISEVVGTGAAVEDAAVTLDTTEKLIVSTPIAEAAEAAAVVEDTAATLDVEGDHSTAITPIPQVSDVTEIAEATKELDLVSEPEATVKLSQKEAWYSFRDTPRPASPLPETRTAVADSITLADTEGAPAKAATPVPSSMVEAPATLEVEAEDRTTLEVEAEDRTTATLEVEAEGHTTATLEVEAADHTKVTEELDTTDTLPVSAIPREPSIDSSDHVVATTPIVDTPKDEVVEATVEASPVEASPVEAASVPQVIGEEDSKSKDGLSDNLLIAGAGLVGAALIGGGIYAVARDDKAEDVSMARTITNESCKSVYDKPLSFNRDHILPHMKELGPQVAETEVHRAEIVRPTSNMLSKSVDAPALDSEDLGYEPRKGVDPVLEPKLTENQSSLVQSHEPDPIPESELAHASKGKETEARTLGAFPESIEEDDFVELLENSGHLQAPRMQRELSGSSEFAESLISVDAISEALRYMRENSSEAAFRPPDIVVSEETTDGEHRTRNIVEVTTPDTELITEPEPRRRDPSTRREQSRPSTRGSDMISATQHKNLMENFWKLVFVGWLGGMGKFFVGLFGRKNGEQLGSVYANYAASMRESQLMSQQNLNFEQNMGGSAKGKEKEKIRGEPREEEIKTKNGVNGNGVSASNGAGGVKVKESRRGSIKKKWNAYRKK